VPYLIEIEGKVNITLKRIKWYLQMKRNIEGTIKIFVNLPFLFILRIDLFFDFFDLKRKNIRFFAGFRMTMLNFETISLFTFHTAYNFDIIFNSKFLKF
jgi:hypothetical protein